MSGAFPAGAATTTLTGTYLDPEGNPLQGTISFALPWVLTLPSAKVISAFPAQVDLDQFGRFSVELISTDNSGMSPNGWTYLVTERLTTSAGVTPPPTRQYSIFLPQNPGTVDISQLAPVSPAQGKYLPVVGPPGPQGNPTVVNGKTGASITLNATDVGADVAGAAAGAQTTAETYTNTQISAEVVRANAAYLPIADPSVTNSRTPTGPAGGDLSGTYPNPGVAKVAGVAVTGTPTAGQVPTASSGTTAAWATPPATLPPSGAAGGDLTGSYPNPGVGKVAGVAVSGTPSTGQVLEATSPTAATWTALPTALPPTGAAGGDLSGTYPNPAVGKVGGIAVSGTPSSGQVLEATSPSAATWTSLPTALPPSGAAGGDLAGTYPNPTLAGTANVESIIRANRLDQLAAPTAAVPMGGQKITGLANGTASTDGAAFGQIPTVLPPTGAAGGDLAGTYPNPTLSGTANVESIIRANRLDQFAAPTAPVAWNSQKITGLANGSAGTDAAAFGQIPTTLPPTGAAGGDLTGTYPNPTLSGTANVESIIRANRLDQLAAPTAPVPFNAQKITGLANGTAAQDAAAFGQIPAALPPSGAASGDLGSTYPAPTVVATHLSAPLPIAQGGTSAATASAGLAALSGTPISAFRSVTTATTANAWDVISCNASGGAFNVTLPTATAGVRVTVKKTDSSANAITLIGTVDGGANPTLNYQWQSVELVADGTNWARASRPALAWLADYPNTTDSRYMQQGSGAGNDLSGNYPNPFVAKVNGTAISGIPSAGYTLLATSGSAASWQALPVATGSVEGIIQLTGDLGNTAASPQVTSTHLSSALPLAQGGTGSTTQNFVDLTTAQTIAGLKTFSSHVAVPGGTVVPLDWYNVKDPAYGAKGDGSTDDTTAINAAITAANAAGGGIVYVPYGTYIVSNVITLKTGVHLLGSHANTWVNRFGTPLCSFKATSGFSGESMISMLGMDITGSGHNEGNCRISNLELDGSAMSTGSVSGIHAQGEVMDVILTHVTIKNFTHNGIHTNIGTGTKAPHDWYLDSVVAYSNALYGFSMSMTDGYFRNCISTTNKSDGWFMGPFGGLTFDGCQALWNTNNGLTLLGGAQTGNLTINGFLTDRNGHDGIHIGPASGIASPPFVLTGITCSRDGRNGNSGGGSYAGVRIDACANPVIINGITVNTGVDDDTTGTNSPQYGLSLTGTNAYVQVNGGYLHGDTTGWQDDLTSTVVRRFNVDEATGPKATPTFVYGNGVGTNQNSLDVPAHAIGIPQPRENGAIAWTYDPASVRSDKLLTNGTLYLASVYVPRSVTATKLMWGINTVGVTATAGQNFVGLYSSAGTRLASVGVDARITTQGLFTETISAALTPGQYWVAVLVNAATAPKLYCGSDLNGTLLNFNTAGATLRFATNGTGLTALPASITPSSNTAVQACLWAALA